MKKAARIILGKGKKIDPGAKIGEPSPRAAGKKPLVIGPGAVVRRGTVVYMGSRIGKDLETGHNSVVREGNVIGDHFRVWNNSTIDYECVIGDRVKVHSNCYVAQFTTLEDDVFLAPGVIIANDLYPGDALSAEKMRGPHLERGVQVGVNSTILPYVRIGAGSVVGSGSVVTRDVAPGMVVAGNPAKPIGTVEESRKHWKQRLLEKAR